MSLAEATTEYEMAGREMAPLDIVVWNLSGDDDVTAAERHDSMEYVLSYLLGEEKDNLFILCQDTIDSPKQKIMSAKLDGITQNDGNTAIYYYSKDYSVQPVPVRSQCLTVFCLTAKNGSKKILLASCHGKHKTSDRINEFNEFLKILDDINFIQRCNGVIVGGDFNLKATIAGEHIPYFDVNRVLLSEYQMPPDRSSSNCVDYFIYWPTDIFNECGPIKTPFNDYKRTKGQRPFNHPILMCRFMTNGPVQQVQEGVLAARFTDLDSDAGRSEFGDEKFQAEVRTWTKRHKVSFFRSIRNEKRRFHDDGASIVFSFRDSPAWSQPPLTEGMSEVSAQDILNCLPKHEIFRARRMLVIKHMSGVCFQQRDQKDLFVSRGCKAYSLQRYHNSLYTYVSPDAACVSVYGLFPLEGYAPLYTPGEPVCCPECPATGDCMTDPCVCRQNNNFCKRCPVGNKSKNKEGCKNKKRPKQEAVSTSEQDAPDVKPYVFA